MKFQCQQCKTRYSIADEKVRGKILKIRCKNCEAIITVREGMGVDEPEKKTGATIAMNVPKLPDDIAAEMFKKPAATAGASASASAGAASPATSGGGDKGDKKKRKSSKSGMGRLPTGAATTGTAGKAAKRKPSEPPAAPPIPPGDSLAEDEWFVSVDGEQEGPFSLDEARERVGRKGTEEELHAWRDGFDEWLPVEQISELASYVPRRSSKERLPIQAAEESDAGLGGESAPALSGLVRDNMKPAADGFFGQPAGGREGGASGDDDSNLDFDIGEASRVVRMPMLAPGFGAAGGGGGGGGGAGPRAPAGLPGMAATAQPAGGMAVGPTAATAIHSTNGAARAAALLERAQMSKIEAPKRKSRAGFILAGIGALVLIGGGSIALYMRARDDGPRVTRDGFSEDLDLYDQGGLPGSGRPGAKAAPGEVGGKIGKGRPRPGTPGATGPRGTNDPGIIAPGGGPGIAGPQGGGVGGPGMIDLDEANRPLSPDDVVMTAGNAANQTGIRLCYEHALKKDPTLAIARMNVTISINTDGSVTQVSMPKREQTAFLTNCLESRIRRWRFRKSTEGLTAEFPLIFSKKS